jgi:hypothetical protein
MTEEHRRPWYTQCYRPALFGHPEGQEETVQIPSNREIGIPLCTDTLTHVMGYLDDGDLLELAHTRQSIFYEVRAFAEQEGRYPFPHAICYKCYRSKDRCGCEDRSKLAVTLYFLGMMIVFFVAVLYPVYHT